MGILEKYKKVLSISIAFIFGVGIIFFALEGNSLLSNGASSKTAGNDSLAVASSDSVGDFLSGQTGLADTGHADNATEYATTTTAVISRQLLIEYAQRQSAAGDTPISDADAQDIANRLALQAVLPTVLPYTIKDLHILNDSSVNAFVTYITKLNPLLNTFATKHTQNEIQIATEALSSHDQSNLDQLVGIANLYRALEQNLLALPVPSKIAPLHLRLVQGYKDLRVATEGMHDMLTDPIKGVASVGHYKDALSALVIVSQDYANLKP